MKGKSGEFKDVSIFLLCLPALGSKLEGIERFKKNLKFMFTSILLVTIPMIVCTGRLHRLPQNGDHALAFAERILTIRDISTIAILDEQIDGIEEMALIQRRPRCIGNEFIFRRQKEGRLREHIS